MVPVIGRFFSSCKLWAVSLIGGVFAVACGSPLGAPLDESYIDVQASEVVHGAVSRGHDSAVVAVVVGENDACSGVLIAPDLVLTARHCISRTTGRAECPHDGPAIQAERDPGDLKILVGESLRDGVISAHGAAIVTELSTDLCDDDIAVIVLDRALASPKASSLSTGAVLSAQRVRTVRFEPVDAVSAAGLKRVREHVSVSGAQRKHFTVAEERGGNGHGGGAALDEDTGAVLGVLSRGAPSAGGVAGTNIYSRVDAHPGLFTRALNHPARASRVGIPKPGSIAPASDVGVACARASDCATSICVHDASGSYCTRTCAQGDGCPRGYRCRAGASGGPTNVCQHVPGG